jgi:2-amino-4-hydroxy-6-hydroxymethyldihydropteridine diphosphokinase
LVKSSLVTIVETSPILRNPPFGYLKQDDFFNAVVHIRTSLMPRELLEYMLRVEKYFGRKREFQDGPRTLDIDLIFYENREINTSRLTVPHPNWQDRDSVKIPLSKMKGKRWSKRLL